MMNISGPEFDFGALAVPKSQKEENRTNLGQEDFLALMITQFQNQDPLQPMENGEFIGQMAQFSTVSGIGDLNKSMARLAESMYANQALQASTMVGRTVLIEGDTARLAENQPLQAGVEMPFPSSSAVVRISDSSGQLIQEIPLGLRNTGVATFEWDGTLADGEPAPAGDYRITAVLRNGAEELPLATYVGTRVQSVTLSADGSSSRLSTADGRQTSVSQVKAIM